MPEEGPLSGVVCAFKLTPTRRAVEAASISSSRPWARKRPWMPGASPHRVPYRTAFRAGASRPTGDQVHPATLDRPPGCWTRQTSIAIAAPWGGNGHPGGNPATSWAAGPGMGFSTCCPRPRAPGGSEADQSFRCRDDAVGDRGSALVGETRRAYPHT